MKRLVLGSFATVAIACSSAMAADMPVKAPPMVAATVFSWTGIYVGAEFGWGGTNATHVRNVANSSFPAGYSASSTESGPLGGGEVGANYQFNWVVVGIEGDMQGSGINGTNTNFSPLVAGRSTTQYRDTLWVGTVTGRLGLAFDHWLVFGKGGAAWRGVKGDLSETFSGTGALLSANQAADSTESGYVVGGGVEWAPSDAVSVKVEYDWYNFGSQLSTASTQFAGGGGGGIGSVVPAGDSTSTPTMWEIKAGVNLRLNWLAAPIASRY